MAKGKGFRCRICTGCGLCPGIVSGEGQRAEKLHVLAEDAFLGEKRPMAGNGRRLVTADVGTTTIAMLLYAADGSVEDRYVAVNPQSVYGADVLSRIRAAERPAAAEDMRRQAETVLEHGIRRFQKRLAEGESLQMVLAANTTMVYLLMGWAPAELGQAPFTASRLAAAETFFGKVPCLILPGISAFVGGDIVAGIQACGMAQRQDLTLLVDLGTNGEMVLGNCDRRIACATAAGPAFEGGVNRGVWGADMVHFLALLRREGVLDATGLLAPEFFETGIRIGNVLVTQEAVRSIQLAKAAIAAGIEILLQHYGVEAEQVDRVVLAGGFGYYLKPEDAAQIGLLPERLAGKAIAGGNTALAGALLAGRALLAGEGARLMDQLEKTVAETETCNLAMEADFQEKYLNAMEMNKK